MMASNSNVNTRIWLEFKTHPRFHAKFDTDPPKKLVQNVFPIISIWEKFLELKSNCEAKKKSGRKSNSYEIL